MLEKSVNLETKISKKYYPFLLKFSLLIWILASIIGANLIYSQKKDLQSVTEKINNISSELSIINEKFQEASEQIEKNNISDIEKNTAENLIKAELLNRFLLINCFFELKNIIDDNREMTNKCFAIFSIEDEYVKNKLSLIDFNKINEVSYVKLKKSFENISKIIQEEISKEKLLKLNIPNKIANYIPKFFSWRKIDDENSENMIESEIILTNSEIYIEEKNINSVINELEKFNNIEMVKKWLEDASIYSNNVNIIDQILNYLLKNGD